MKKFRSLASILALTIVVFGAGPAGAASYIDVNSPGGLHFKLDGKTLEMTFDIKKTKVDSVSGGSSDPLVGNYLIIATSNPTYDYSLDKEISPGVWTTSNETASFIVESPGSKPTEYLKASAVAQTVDFNTGTIAWSTLSSLSTFNVDTLNSLTLREFSNYNTGQFTFSFETSQALRDYVSGVTTGNTLSVNYSGRLEGGITGAPEPSQGALLLLGLTLIGLYGLAGKRQDFIVFCFRRRGKF